MAFSALFTNLVAAQPSNDRVSPRKTVESSGKTDDRAGKTDDRAGKTGDQADKTGNNNDETEVLAWQLVETHLPELNIVLDRLRTGEPRQYQRAISDLARSAKKLEAFRKRDEQLFEIEVELLKTQHAVSLLTASVYAKRWSSFIKRRSSEPSTT